VARNRRVVDLESARVERLADGLVEELRFSGVIRREASTVEDIDRWRRAARRAGKRIGVRVRSGESNGIVWVASLDRVPTPAEQDVAATRVAAQIFNPDE
jgi:hypothetical protein